MKLHNAAEQSGQCKPLGCRAMSCVNSMRDPPLCNKLLNEYRACKKSLFI